MYKTKPKIILLEHTQDFETEFRNRYDVNLDDKIRNLHNLLSYAKNQEIPVFSNHETGSCRNLDVTPIQYINWSEKDWIRRVLNNNPELAKQIMKLSDGDIIITGGAHIWADRGKSIKEKLCSYYDRTLNFRGCIGYPVLFIDRIKKHYNRDLTTIIDPRITVEGSNKKMPINNSRLYEVVDGSDLYLDMKMRPSRKYQQ